MWDKKIFPQANMVQDARATAILGTCKSAGDRVFESRRPHHLLFDRAELSVTFVEVGVNEMKNENATFSTRSRKTDLG